MSDVRYDRCHYAQVNGTEKKVSVKPQYVVKSRVSDMAGLSLCFSELLHERRLI